MIHNLKMIVKTNIREKSVLFWVFAYPILFVSILYFAFSGIETTKLDKINIGVENDQIKTYLSSIDFIKAEVMTSEKADKLLEKEKISSFVNADMKIKVKSSGYKQSAVKSILDDISHIKSSGMSFKSYYDSQNYIKTTDQDKDEKFNYFYSAIAMMTLYAYSISLFMSNIFQANLSTIGQRVEMSVLKREDFLLSAFIASISINIFSNIALLLFMKFVLSIDIIKDLFGTISLIIAGNLFGTALGFIIGSTKLSNDNLKLGFAIFVQLLLSFFSGLMGIKVRLFIDKIFPIINKINPVAIVSDNMIFVNKLNIYDNFNSGLITIFSISLLMYIVSFLILRRRKYDSI